MKNLLKIVVLLITGIMMSCQPEQIIDPNDQNVNVRDGGALLNGSYDEDIVLKSGITYILSGGVHFEDNASLTIEPGVVVESDPLVSSAPFCYLMIEKGAKIYAEGTVTEPIVFTSGKTTPTPGDWGGIIINGNAPVNKGINVDSEIAGYPYGGPDATDNSGTLRYVRVEYGGAKIDPDTEHNGFTFNGVGNETAVEYIEAINGTDDGIEMFGGTVNLKYVISWNNTDDGFDWTYGWSGKAQHMIIKTGEYGDRGIEADNNSSNHSIEPFSNPIISNVTIISSGTQNEDSGDPQGVELRRGTKGQFYNFIIKNFLGNSIRISDEQTHRNVEQKQIIFDYSYMEGEPGYKVNGIISEQNRLETSNNLKINQSFELQNGFVGTFPEGFDVSSINNWFDNVDYIGAVKTTSNWTTDWTSF